MSRDFPVLDCSGHVQLDAVVRDGELTLIVGQPGEPGAAEFIAAITKMAALCNTWRSSGPVRRAARKEFDTAIEALSSAGRVV